MTDLHLFLDDHGNERHPTEAGRVISALSRFRVAGLERHDNTLWNSLKERLPQIVAGEREADPSIPIVVVQTGDVEAYGMGGGAVPFTAFTAWQRALWPAVAEAGATACIDLFGNHDLWDRTLPLTSRRNAASVLGRLRNRHGMGGPWPNRAAFPLPTGGRLEIYRVNSVALGRGRAFLAGGAVSPLPPGRTRGRAPRACRAIQDLCGPAKVEAPTIRVAAMHHPPHAFAASLLHRLTNCNVRGADELARLAERLPIHLIVAGHRHAMDPRNRLPRSPAHPLQPPLPGRTPQLVAESPTQPYRHSDGRERGRNSLSVYRLFVDDETQLSVRRVLFRASNARGPYPGDNFLADAPAGDLVAHDVPL